MAKLLWGIVCSRIITDSDTNTVSYIDAIEGIAVPAFPFPLPQVSLGLLWRRSEPDEKLSIRFRLLLPGASDSSHYDMTDMILHKSNHRTTVQIGGQLLVKEGDFRITVERLVNDKWRKAYEISIPVILDSGQTRDPSQK